MDPTRNPAGLPDSIQVPIALVYAENSDEQLLPHSRALPPLPATMIPEPQADNADAATIQLPFVSIALSDTPAVRVPSPVHRARGSDSSQSAHTARPRDPTSNAYFQARGSDSSDSPPHRPAHPNRSLSSAASQGIASFLTEPIAGPSRQTTPPRDPGTALAGEFPPAQQPSPPARPVSDMGPVHPRHPALAHPVRALSYDARAVARERRAVLHSEGHRSQRSVIDYVVPEFELGAAGVGGNGNAGMFNGNGNSNGNGHGHGHERGHGHHDEKRASSMATSSAQREKTVEERLQRTLQHANDELKRYVAKSRMTGYALNACIGAQVLLGALTTGVAAATSGRDTSIATSVLGGLSTLAASYLARARGSGEPEASTARCKDLEHFIRECEAFVLDYGYLGGPGSPPLEPHINRQVERFRWRFEEIMGATSGVSGGGSGETRSPMQEKMQSQV